KAKHIASTLDDLNMDLDSSYYDIVKIKNPSSKNKGRVRLIILKTAAILVFFISSTYIFKDNIFDSGVESIIPEDAIILKLGDGNIEVIAEDGTAKVVDSEGNLLGTQQGSRLVYKNMDTSKEELTYNTLTVPYGKRFDLKLSDGTQITLNSGTSLKYPVQFL